MNIINKEKECFVRSYGGFSETGFSGFIAPYSREEKPFPCHEFVKVSKKDCPYEMIASIYHKITKIECYAWNIQGSLHNYLWSSLSTIFDEEDTKV